MATSGKRTLQPKRDAHLTTRDRAEDISDQLAIEVGCHWFPPIQAGRSLSRRQATVEQLKNLSKEER